MKQTTTHLTLDPTSPSEQQHSPPVQPPAHPEGSTPHTPAPVIIAPSPVATPVMPPPPRDSLPPPSRPASPMDDPSRPASPVDVPSRPASPMDAPSRPASPMGIQSRLQSPVQAPPPKGLIPVQSVLCNPTDLQSGTDRHPAPNSHEDQPAPTSLPLDSSPTAPLVPAKRSFNEEDPAMSSKRGCTVPTPAKSVRPKPKARGLKKTKVTGVTQGLSPSTALTTSTSTTSSYPAIPSTPFEPAVNAPKWFASAIKKLQSATIDERFNTLIHTWAAFEMKENYAEVSKLDAKHRPTIIGDWIQRGRSEKWVPPTFDALRFEKQFQQWWFHLQPVWRRETDQDVAWGTIEGDLTHLRKPGTNGLLSVVAGLFFWGSNVKKGSAGWDRYVVHVKDVQAVLSGLVWPSSSL